VAQVGHRGRGGHRPHTAGGRRPAAAGGSRARGPAGASKLPAGLPPLHLVAGGPNLQQAMRQQPGGAVTRRACTPLPAHDPESAHTRTDYTPCTPYTPCTRAPEPVPPLTPP
jgi:hypothetical protein